VGAGRADAHRLHRGDGAVFGATGAPTVAVYLVDEDGGRMSRQIISALRDEPTLAIDRLTRAPRPMRGSAPANAWPPSCCPPG
jgi:hypothetical protein